MSILIGIGIFALGAVVALVGGYIFLAWALKDAYRK